MLIIPLDVILECYRYCDVHTIEKYHLHNVMYGNACFLAPSYLSLCKGIVSCILLIVIYIKCTMIHNAHLWVPLSERDIMLQATTIYSPLL